MRRWKTFLNFLTTKFGFELLGYDVHSKVNEIQNPKIQKQTRIGVVGQLHDHQRNKNLTKISTKKLIFFFFANSAKAGIYTQLRNLQGQGVLIETSKNILIDLLLQKK